MRNKNKNSAHFNHPDWSIEAYDLTREFIETNETFPNNTIFVGANYNKGYISFDRLVKKIIELGGEVIFKSSTYNLGPRKVYYFVDDRYYIFENVHYRKHDNFIGVNDDEKGKLMSIVGSLTVMHKEEVLDKSVVDIIEGCLLKTETVPMIGIISRDQSGFFLNEIKMEADVSNELNLHYGSTFDKFHEKLLEKLINTNKGLTLLHGDPGTGKSSYIRKLIYDLKQETNKKIIIVPNNLIGYLVDPEFNTFLLDTIESYQYDDEEYGEFSEDGDDDTEDENILNGMILILEDAESVLLKRERGDSNQGTSNILNLTDGLLNDIFGIQVICTYNTSDDNIDPAVMRSKRLIAKRNFKKLSIENSKKLAIHLGVPDVKLITKTMSVADIYSMLDKESEDILIQKDDSDVEIGFKI